MKKAWMILFYIVLALIISGCSKDEAMNENFKPTEIEGISMAIKENSLTNKEATIIIKDTNKKGTYIYGDSFWIDKKENDNWISLTTIGKNCGFNDIAYYTNDEGLLELKQNWDCMYGGLEAGTYRLVKDISLDSDVPLTESDKKYIAVEFTIE